MKKFVVFILFFALLNSLVPMNTLALTLEKLPTSKSTDQWTW